MAIEHFSELDDQLVVGSCPSSLEDIQALAALGVKALVNLQSDIDLRSRALEWTVLWPLYLRHGISAVRVPIIDFEPADLARHIDAAVTAVAKQVDAGKRVYVHCNAGLNRSPSVVIGFLMLSRGLPLKEATAWVKERHECVPYPDVIRGWAMRRNLVV